MWLPWQDAAWLALLAVVCAVALRLAAPTRARGFRALCEEGFLVAVLYALWQRACDLPPGSTERAVARGEQILHLERAWHLPSEVWTQQLALHSHLLVKGANWYYLLGHAPVMGVFLVWLYGWHRADFARWRTSLGLASILSELIQIVPVAPPRLAVHGIVDTAQVYGPSVYGADGGGFAPQLGAMPSIHCVWALTIALAVWHVGRGPWRWIGAVHAAVTVLVVVLTGNHYWLDAIAGGALVLLGLAAHEAGARVWARLRPVATADHGATIDSAPSIVG
jgi:hypothetical protein